LFLSALLSIHLMDVIDTISISHYRTLRNSELFDFCYLSPKAGLSTAWVSGVFLIFGIIYTCICPVVAKYSNIMREPIWLLFTASLLYILAFALFAISDRGM